MGLAAIATLALALLTPPSFAAEPASSAKPSEPAAVTPTYGGPFTLVDHKGRTVTDKTFRGSYMLIYFGYTYCPDVCPTGLQTMAHALNMMGADAAHIQPIFVSVDDKRDTPEVLAEYVTYFHPRLIGLTGTARQIHEAASAYNARYRIFEYKGDILVDHTGYTYLVGPDGKFLADFRHGIDPKEMAAGVLKYMNRDRPRLGMGEKP